MSAKARTILTSVLVTLVVVLILQNLRLTSVRVVIWEMVMPLALVLFLAFVAGCAAGWFWRRG